ncbi:hypothetical protein [Spirosoma spitsbergense]|uniref:hypothetical protein n=1 Tax=Spirosoma spitsbergense TaxID=431554 RepID=UPI0003695561|nr:hypothetical protein [Spirosoma spitsbergense]
MKTNAILIGLYSNRHNEAAMQAICGHWKSDIETRQVCEYTIENGVATIAAMRPLIATVINLPLPLYVPVTDLGSGTLNRIDINVDTLTPMPAVCPCTIWQTKRMQQPAPPVTQTLMADYIGLL